MGFVKKLFKVFVEDQGAHRNKLFLRNMNSVDPLLSDLQIFESLPLGDIWEDASLASVYFYIRGNPHLVVPNSWAACIEAFDVELDRKATWTK